MRPGGAISTVARRWACDPTTTSSAGSCRDVCCSCSTTSAPGGIAAISRAPGGRGRRARHITASLHLSVERELPVEPLPDKPPSSSFEPRSRRRAPPRCRRDGRSVCRRLDNLRLAIELAAARAKSAALRPAAAPRRGVPLLAGGAVDLPERQRTLRATIGGATSSSTGREGRFPRLSVFLGSSLWRPPRRPGADLDELQHSSTRVC